MRPITYVPPAGPQMDALMSSDGVMDAMAEAAQAGVEYAQSIAPVESGEYKAAFAVELADNRVHLVNNAEHAAAVEWGNRGREGQKILAQTIDYLEGGR